MMASIKDDTVTLGSDKSPAHGRLLVRRLETLPDLEQKISAEDILKELLGKAAQPRHASGNACLKLCYFVEQCMTSKSQVLRELAYSEKTSLELFDFYIEWTEKNQHRSMRQVLDLLASLLSRNPDRDSADKVVHAVLLRALSIITHQSAQPLVKPAFRSLECFLGKGIISSVALIDFYRNQSNKIVPNEPRSEESIEADSAWDVFMAEIFTWLALPDISPAAGKFLVTLFMKLGQEATDTNHTVLWQRWIRRGLNRNPGMLENVKNYLFPPLFKLDRAGSILFLKDLNTQGSMTDLQSEDFDGYALLQLAAIEVGKKLGLVEEPCELRILKGSKKAIVVLDELSIGELLTHTSDTVRSLAFSVLVSSVSSIRPFSPSALNLFQMHMAVLYADTDAKFRNETLSNTRHLIERLRGSIAYLTRELETIGFLLDARKHAQGGFEPEGDAESFHQISGLLQTHERFLLWYLRFLSSELIPTASYQRHITALKAITLFLRSGIIRSDSSLTLSKNSDNTSSWPFTVQLFTSGNVRLLLDLLMDPFEDVRISAGNVLRFASRDNFTERVAANTAFSHNSPRDTTIAKETTIESLLDLGLHRVTPSFVNDFPVTPQILLDFVNRAEEAAKRTGRADFGDGAARAYEIMLSLSPSTYARFKLVDNMVEQLELKVMIAEDDLARAVLESPIHGSFAALNFVWDSFDPSECLENSSDQQPEIEDWNKLQFRMLDCCRRVWIAVRDILCNDSPEGHLPTDLDEIDSLDTKDILSYSFRATHESSNLMNTIIGKIKANWKDGISVLPLNVFSGIGDLTFEQLSSLRHRGAFSTVSLTFSRCCQLTQARPATAHSNQDLLERWYEGALQCITEQESTTRRSAGIPALITGILSSNAQKPAFEDVVNGLETLARAPVKLSKQDETNLFQVHSMNCLKDIFKSSLLGKRAESHIADCLQIAADSLHSEVWAIRNCGLLLLRSLIDALLGTNESKVAIEAGWDGRSVKLSYDKFPALPKLLLKLMDTEPSLSEISSTPKISSVESMFPALDIIRRAGPPSTEYKEILDSVSKHLGSKVWHVREITARAVCTLLLHDNWLSKIMKLLEESFQSTNFLHGVLMTLKFVLDRRLTLNPETAIDGLDHIAQALQNSGISSISYRGCPQISAAHLEVRNTIARIILSARKSGTIADRLNSAPVINLLFAQDAFEEFLQMTTTYPTLIASISGAGYSVNASLTFDAFARQSVFTTALRNDHPGLQKIINLTAALDTDIALAAIEAIPHAWRSNDSIEASSGLVKTYVGAIKRTQSSEVRAAALSNLAVIVDQLLGHTDLERRDCGQIIGSVKTTRPSNSDLSEIVCRQIKTLVPLLQHGVKTPSLSNAEIRISGSLLICDYLSRNDASQGLEVYELRMEWWGKLLVQAGNARSDFETRFAAAAALASFYNSPYLQSLGEECSLPSLFALYDTLNDDDDEIRNLSAKTVSALLRKSLVPLAASVELGEYMSKMYASNRSFAWNVICRMTGNKLEAVDDNRLHLEPFDGQLANELEDDDSLFVEEEQNLFIDEVRDAKLWSKIFKQMVFDTSSQDQEEPDVELTWTAPQMSLAIWVKDGLLAACSLLGKEDGPLGWASKPAVFALLTRLLLSADALLRHNEVVPSSEADNSVPKKTVIGDVKFALGKFVILGKERNIHQSLLLEVHGMSSLSLNDLRWSTPEILRPIK